KAVENTLSQVFSSSILCLGLFVLGAAVLSISLSHLQTVEPRSYLEMYAGAVALLFFLIILTAVQFLDVWTKLERVLDEMESHPVRFALSDLPPDRTWSP